MWYEQADVWHWWETVFQIHYRNRYFSYDITDFNTDVYEGVDAIIHVNATNTPLRIQLKSNSARAIDDLPIDFNYQNENGVPSGFGLYFETTHSINTFMFGYPYANVALIVAYPVMYTFWTKNHSKLKRYNTRNGKNKNRYIRLTLGAFLEEINVHENPFAELYVFDYA